MSAEPVRSTSDAPWTRPDAPWTRPVPPPHPLTVADYLAVDDVEPGRTELVEGQLLMSPGLVPDHIHAGMEIAYQLRGQLPQEWEALTEPDIDLQLTPADAPGTVRRPDVVIVTREARRRVRVERGFIRASEAAIAVEILSPGSRRTDHVTKRSEYADAGIPHYWIVDLSDPVSLLACHLAGEFGYADGGVVTGTYSAAAPFPVELDLDALV